MSYFLVCLVYVAVMQKKDKKKIHFQVHQWQRTYKIVTIFSSITFKILTKTTCRHKRQSERTSANDIT